MPWQTAEKIVSMIGPVRLGDGDEQVLLERPHLGVAAVPLVGVPLVARIGGVEHHRDAGLLDAAQNGSLSGRNGERGPRKPATGAGRTSTVLAPCSRAHSSSATAPSAVARLITGVVKIRPWWSKPHSS